LDDSRQVISAPLLISHSLEENKPHYALGCFFSRGALDLLENCSSEELIEAEEPRNKLFRDFSSVHHDIFSI